MPGNIIELDGSTGEGGGQVVRLAVCLAAITTQPIRITNVRGNRPGSRNGGLKSQHVTAIDFLARATHAQTDGLSVGSHTLLFAPSKPPTDVQEREMTIRAETSSASTLLVFQAIMPFLVFAADAKSEPIRLDIFGGTNVSFSLSYEYLDQVLLPTLEERFHLKVERTLVARAWSLGPPSRNAGCIRLKIRPIPKGESLHFQPWATASQPGGLGISQIGVTIVAPKKSHGQLQQDLAHSLGSLFPSAEVKFRESEDSNLDSRWYILLVAISDSGRRWGKDVLTSLPKKTKSPENFVSSLSRKLCKELFKEVEQGGDVDEHLQDQLIVFQALAGTYSIFQWECSDVPPAVDSQGCLQINESELKKLRAAKLGGSGTMHTRTARWVVSEIVPGVQFFKEGELAKGVGLSFS